MKTYTSKDLPKDGSEIKIHMPKQGGLLAMDATLKYDKKNFTFNLSMSTRRETVNITVGEKDVLNRLNNGYYILKEEMSKESKHTPENKAWKVDCGGDVDYDKTVTVSVYSDEGTVAMVNGGPNDIDGKKAFARAHLIAAAPELLEALKNLVKLSEVSGIADSDPIEYLSAISAIVKAEGKQ